MIKSVIDNLYEISLGVVNVHLINLQEELILIDTGSSVDHQWTVAALSEIGRKLTGLTHIVVTYCHADHAGVLAALQAQTNALTTMHPIDGAMVQKGKSLRPLTPAPGLLTKLLFRLFVASAPESIAPACIDRVAAHLEILSLASGLQNIHAPGRNAGQIALLWSGKKGFVCR